MGILDAILGAVVTALVGVIYVGVFSLGLIPGALFFPLMVRYCRRTAPGWWLVYCLAATPVLVLLMVGLTEAGRTMSGFDPLLPFFFALLMGWCLVAMWMAWIWVRIIRTKPTQAGSCERKQFSSDDEHFEA